MPDFADARERAVFNLCRRFLDEVVGEGKGDLNTFYSEFLKLLGSTDITTISPGRFNSLLILHACGVLGKEMSLEQALKEHFPAEDYWQTYICQVNGHYCLVESRGSSYTVDILDELSEYKPSGYTSGIGGLLNRLTYVSEKEEIIKDIKYWLELDK